MDVKRPRNSSINEYKTVGSLNIDFDSDAKKRKSHQPLTNSADMAKSPKNNLSIFLSDKTQNTKSEPKSPCKKHGGLADILESLESPTMSPVKNKKNRK